MKAGDSFADVSAKYEWLARDNKGVIKPDQLIKRRGKLGLVKIGTPAELASWFEKTANTYVKVGQTEGRLHTFIVEPFCAHTDEDEMYIAIFSERCRDVIMFYEHGGVDIGDVEEKVSD